MSGSRITKLGIHVKVADISRSRRFYESLGFQAVFGYGDDAFRASLPSGIGSAPERYRGVTYQVGDSALLEIAEGHIAVPETAVFQERVVSPKVSAMVHVDSLVPVFSNPLIELKYPVRHYYWNTIEAAFRDPDGFVLVLIAPFSAAELNALRPLTTVETVEPSGTS